MKLKMLFVFLFISGAAFCQYGYINYSDTFYICHKKCISPSYFNIIDCYEIVRPNIEKSRLKISYIGDSIKKSQIYIDSSCIFEWIDSLKVFKKDSVFLNNKLIEVSGYTTQLKLDSSFQHAFDISYPNAIYLNLKKIKNGKSNLYYINGTKYSSGNYIVGRHGIELKKGVWTYWYQNLNVKKVENYTILPYCVLSNNKNIGISERKYFDNFISVLDADYCEYFENGKIKIKGKYGISNLTQKMIFDIREAYMENGIWEGSLKEGKWIEFNENGEIIKTNYYNAGILQKEVILSH